MVKKLTPYELKYKILAADPTNHFFDYKTMRFFGDTMKNFGCRIAVIKIIGETKEVYELYRIKAVKGRLKSSFFFDPETFKKVYPDNND